MYSIFINICVLSLYTYPTIARSCEPHKDRCSCKWTDSKKIITLHAFDSITAEATFKNIKQQGKDLYFDYNPCTPFNEGYDPEKPNSGCVDAIVCQHNKEETDFYLAGEAKSFTTNMNGPNLMFIYIGAEMRKTEITLICDTSAATPIMSNPIEGPTDTYKFNVTTKCACPDGCVGSSSGGLSTGSVLLILFFVFVIVYFVGGFLLLKFYKKKEGTEAIPQYEFWKDFPAKVKDGCVYTKDIMKGWKGRSEYQEI